MEGLSPEGHRDTVTDERLGMSAPPGTFFDLAPMAVLTTATSTDWLSCTRKEASTSGASG